MSDPTESPATVWGEWWIETRDDTPTPYAPPEHTAAGVLHAAGYTDWHLETSGSLIKGMPVFPGNHPATREPQSIWGADQLGNLYSILEAHHTGSHYRSSHPRGGIQRWYTGAIAQSRDVWITLGDEIDQLNVHLPGLETWIQDSVSNVDWDHETETITAPAEARSIQTQVLGKNVELRWGNQRSSPTNSAGTSVHITPRASICISGAQSITEVHDKWVYPLRLMFSMFFMQPSVIDNVNGRLAGLDEYSDEIDVWRQPRVELRFTQPSSDDRLIEPTDADDSLAWHRMLATRATLANAGFDFDRLLPAFYNVLDGSWLDVALEYLIESQVKQSGFTFDDMFLYAFKGIESMHTHWFGEKAVEQLDMVKACFDKCGDTANMLRTIYGNIETAIRDARNEVVHPRKRRRGASEQVVLLSVVQWLLRHSLLQAIGLSSQACDIIVTNNSLFKNILPDLEEYQQRAAR